MSDFIAKNTLSFFSTVAFSLSPAALQVKRRADFYYFFFSSVELNLRKEAAIQDGKKYEFSSF